MTSTAPTPDVVDLDAPDSPLAAWDAAIAAGGPDHFAWTCAPWCVVGPDHPSTTIPEDRACCSAEAAVALVHYRGDELAPARAEVGIVQRADEREPVVVVDRRSYSWQSGGAVAEHFEALRMTPAEAHQLAATLVLAADAATAGGVR